MNAWPLSLALLAACEPKETPETTPEPVSPSETTPETTPEPETTATGSTGDTGAGPATSSWSGLYPPVPYDCAQGVPAGPFQAAPVPGVLTTEDFAFTADGWLVSADWNRNLFRFDPAGQGSVLVPNAAETRGIDVLPDGDVVVTDVTVARVKRVASSGAVTDIANVGVNPSGIDVALDGTVYAGDISTGGVYEIALDGTVTDLGPVDPNTFVQTYGVALSVDEQTLYVSQYNGDQIYRLQRDAAGVWSTPEPWVSVDGSGLAGLAVDACDNLYVMASFGCQLFRVTPSGDPELITSLDPPGEYCPSLGFGRDVGGWDPLSLYVSTYNVLARIEVGVPGKPR